MCGLGTVAVDDPGPITRTLAFAAPWPNPAGRAMNFEFQLPARATVRAEIIDVAGRHIASLLENKAMDAGTHRLQWDGRDASGRKVTPGIYVVRISTGEESATRRIVVL
jgi:flagellar hook assembly protein FlgD